MKIKLVTAGVSIVGFALAGQALAADPAVMTKPAIARICTNCHKAEPGALRGYFDNVAFKSKTIQLKLDDSVELIKFDAATLKVVSGEGVAGNGDLLKKTKKGHEVKLEFVEKDGVKTALKLTEKPPVKVSPEMLVTTEAMEKLVALGPEKGKYFLYDSRPLPRFQEGAIPTAINLPFPAFDKLVDKLPKDKNAQIIFYCAGPACNMSPGSATKAKALGYTNLKVYKDGMPAWLERNSGVIPVQSLKDAWLDKGIPLVLLDARDEKEFVQTAMKGAVVFPAKQAASLVKALDVKKSAPVMVYDRNGGADAAAIAATLVKAGFKKVLTVTGGFDAWQSAKFEAVPGKLSAKASYVPVPKPGEISLDEFKKYVESLPANVMIIDVRNQDEGAAGMLKTAKLIPADEIKARAAEVPRDKLIVTYCSTGIRAEMAYHALRELGYTNVRFVNAKLEIEKNGSYKITKE